MASQYQSTDPRYHATNIRQMLNEVSDHIEKDLTALTDLQAKALFETTRLVLNGLVRAFENFERGDSVWRESHPGT
ncbi:MAG TPA: hypothetical protein VNO55_17530 [Polyangia bacterium]|nr:hypothetical protein [Polyangia bacterium]